METVYSDLTHSLPFMINTVNDVFVEVAVSTLSCTIRPMNVNSNLMQINSTNCPFSVHPPYPPTSVLTVLTDFFPKLGNFLHSWQNINKTRLFSLKFIKCSFSEIYQHLTVIISRNKTHVSLRTFLSMGFNERSS